MLGMTVVLSACGSGLSGKFGSEKDGKVYITAANDTQAFKFDHAGCIDGGFLFGTLCKK
jgi:hypothetical protein